MQVPVADAVIVEQLTADPTKANTILGWWPETSFEQLVRRMVDSDLEIEAAKRVPGT